MPSKRAYTGLNWLNFFAADISNGIGPFLAIYLTTNLHWHPNEIGIALAATNFAMVAGQSPAGFIIDKTIYKRAIIIIASCIMGIVGCSVSFLPYFGYILFAQVMMGLAGSFYTPDLVALASTLSA